MSTLARYLLLLYRDFLYVGTVLRTIPRSRWSLARTLPSGCGYQQPTTPPEQHQYDHQFHLPRTSEISTIHSKYYVVYWWIAFPWFVYCDLEWKKHIVQIKPYFSISNRIPPRILSSIQSIFSKLMYISCFGSKPVDPTLSAEAMDFHPRIQEYYCPWYHPSDHKRLVAPVDHHIYSPWEVSPPPILHSDRIFWIPHYSLVLSLEAGLEVVMHSKT